MGEDQFENDPRRILPGELHQCMVCVLGLVRLSLFRSKYDETKGNRKLGIKITNIIWGKPPKWHFRFELAEPRGGAYSVIPN